MCLQFFCVFYKIILATTAAKIICKNYRLFCYSVTLYEQEWNEHLLIVIQMVV